MKIDATFVICRFPVYTFVWMTDLAVAEISNFRFVLRNSRGMIGATRKLSRQKRKVSRTSVKFREAHRARSRRIELITRIINISDAN